MFEDIYRTQRVIPFRCLKLISCNYIAVGLNMTKRNLEIIDLNSFEIVKLLETQSADVWSLTFNPDENLLFSGLLNGLIKIWQF
jgi:WD40 repeat protein